MDVDRPDGSDQKHQELHVGVGLVLRVQQIDPGSVDIDQLLCLPEPLTPAKGFSCSRAWRPNRGATRFRVSISSIW